MEPLVFSTHWATYEFVNNNKEPLVVDGAHVCGACFSPLVLWPPVESESESGQSWRCERPLCSQRFIVAYDRSATTVYGVSSWRALGYDREKFSDIWNLKVASAAYSFPSNEICWLCGVKIVKQEMPFPDIWFVCRECTALCGLEAYDFPYDVALNCPRLPK